MTVNVRRRTLMEREDVFCRVLMFYDGPGVPLSVDVLNKTDGTEFIYVPKGNQADLLTVFNHPFLYAPAAPAAA